MTDSTIRIVVDLKGMELDSLRYILEQRKQYWDVHGQDSITGAGSFYRMHRRLLAAIDVATYNGPPASSPVPEVLYHAVPTEEIAAKIRKDGLAPFGGRRTVALSETREQATAGRRAGYAVLQVSAREATAVGVQITAAGPNSWETRQRVPGYLADD